MSASQSWLTNLLGGGIAVTSGGDSFSTIYDPTTGSFKTSIKAGDTGVSVAGAGQTPVSAWQSLTTTTSGMYILAAGAIILVILIVSHLGKRL